MSTKEKLILCVGSCILDIIHVCDSYPKELSNPSYQHGRWQRGGNASINATVLAQLGNRCEFQGVLSKASEAKFLDQDFHEKGIITNHCPRVENFPPFSSSIVNQQNGKATTILAQNDFPYLKQDHFDKIDLNKYKWIHFEGISVSETSSMMKRIETYNKNAMNPIKVSVELDKPGTEYFSLIGTADYIFISRRYGEACGYQTGPETIEPVVKYIKDRFGREKYTIIASFLTDGVWWRDETGHVDHVDYIPHKNTQGFCEYKDPIGLNDTFVSGIIHHLNKSRSVRDACALGSQIMAFKPFGIGYDHIGRYVCKK